MAQMKAHAVIFLSCVCSISAITVHYQSPQTSDKQAKEYKTALKDIRLVPTSQVESVKKSPALAKEESNLRRQSPQPTKSRGDKKKFTPTISRTGSNQNIQVDPNHLQYMQKMANQLYLAQKHASLLSDYQKFILNQNQNVKNFVLAQPQQERNQKPFSRQRQTGRALSLQSAVKYVSPEPEASTDFKKLAVVTPKVETAAQIISKPQDDHLAQPTHIKYVTVAPQSLTHFAESPRVTYVPYHSPQQYTYYDLGVTAKPHVVQIPTTVSLGLSSYESPSYYTSEGGHTEDSLHHEDANYEFMYNVKDHEKHNHFGHKESRTDKTTYGYYFVHLPDGRLETVKYWADKTGYHAKVDYQGEAKHPEPKLHGHNFVHH